LCQSVLAAIGVTVPVHSLTKENIDQFGRSVMKAAAEISHVLSYGDFKKNQFNKVIRCRVATVEDL